jgi:phospholipid/cholesterol/gamma-HCH transport system substrate-binding protein
MESEARYTYVGVAVLVLVAALVAAVVWLKNVGGKADFNYYAINFERQSLDGLAVGADVNLRGIKVGRVEDYALSGQKFNRVRVEVRIDRRVPVRTNTVAVVTRNFVTDIAAITLVTPEPPGEVLAAVPAGEPYPLIGEGHSDLEEIAGRVSKVGEMASVALTNINQMLDAENREAVIATVRSLRELSAGLNQRLGTLDQTLQRVGTAAARLGGAGERIATVAEQGGQRLDVTLAETERTLAEARSALNRIAAATETFQSQTVATARRLEDSAATVDVQLDAAVNELRLSVETASRALDSLRDPRAALLGPGRAQLGPGERLP